MSTWKPQQRMDKPVCDDYLRTLVEEVNDHGMNKEICEQIAFAFINGAASCSRSLVTELLSSFVSYRTNPIYVNEIRNLLYENEPALFKEYAKSFMDCVGSREVFGVEPVNPQPPNLEIPEDEEAEENTAKTIKERKRSKRMKKRIRMNAKDAAADRYREQINKRKEKKKKRKEFEELVRRENGS